MRLAKRLGKPIIAHCEDESCPQDSPESEWRQQARPAAGGKNRLPLPRVPPVHSAVGGADARVQGARRRRHLRDGPHYLVFCEEDVRDSGRFRMNPPIRTRADREALIEGLADGTIDMIATDHAPHAAAEKSWATPGVSTAWSGWRPPSRRCLPTWCCPAGSRSRGCSRRCAMRPGPASASPAG